MEGLAADRAADADAGRAASGTAYPWRPWLLVAAVAAGVVFADQLTKHLIADSITPGDSRHVLPGLQFVHTMNAGVAFGLALGGHVLLVAVIGAVLIAVLVYFARRPGRHLAWLPTGLLLGGALSNIFDRLNDGSVTDFIKLPLGWPPFNVADMSITIGVAILALVVEGGVRGDGSARAAGLDGAPGAGAPR